MGDMAVTNNKPSFIAIGFYHSAYRITEIILIPCLIQIRVIKASSTRNSKKQRQRYALIVHLHTSFAMERNARNKCICVVIVADHFWKLLPPG